MAIINFAILVRNKISKNKFILPNTVGNVIFVSCVVQRMVLTCCTRDLAIQDHTHLMDTKPKAMSLASSFLGLKLFYLTYELIKFDHS